MKKEVCNEVFKTILFLDNYMGKRMNEIDVLQGNNSLYCILVNFLYSQSKEGRVIIQKDIEKEFCVSRSSVNDTIERMKNEGLISLEVDPLDQRKRHIVLTEKGIDLHEKSEKNMSDIAKDSLSCLSKEEIDLLDDLLLKVKKGAIN